MPTGAVGRAACKQIDTTAEPLANGAQVGAIAPRARCLITRATRAAHAALDSNKRNQRRVT